MNPSQLLHLTLLLLITMMGAAVTTLMPLLVGAYTHEGHFTDTQVGWLASADVLGILITSASAYLWARRVPWRQITFIATVIFIVCNVLSTHVTEFSSLYAIRVIAGIACGATYAIALAAMGDFPNSDKAFSGVVTIQVIFGTVGFWVLPEIIGEQGLAGLFHFFNICLAPIALISLFTFPDNVKSGMKQTIKIDGDIKAALLIFAAVVSYYFAQGTVWAYLELIGSDAGLTPATIGEILAIGFAISAFGSVVSGQFASRFGRNSGFVITFVIQIPCLVALYFMNSDNAFWIYAITTVLYQIMWSFVVPLQMAIFNDVDRSGKLIVLCVSAFKVGLVIGPPVAGYIVASAGIKPVLIIGGVAILVSVIFAIQAQSALNRES